MLLIKRHNNSDEMEKHQQFISYTGLSPVEYSSGNNIRSRSKNCITQFMLAAAVFDLDCVFNFINFFYCSQ